MLPDLAPTLWPSLISCSVGLAGLLLRLRRNAKAKDHLFAAAFLLIVLTSGIATVDSARRVRDAEHLGARILVVLGNREQTFEELLAETGFPDRASVTAALERLASQDRIDSRLEDVDLQRRNVQLRLWFAKAR